MAGFTVNHATLDALATQLDQAGHDLQVTDGRLQNPPELTPDYFGDYGVPDAVQAFVTSWQAELKLNVQALQDMADKVRQSASNYRSADQSAADSLAHRAG